MANKSLVMDAYEDTTGYRNLTLFSGSVKDEAIYAEFYANTQEAPDLIEMATSVEEMIKMRDFLNTIISRIEKREAN